MIELMPHNKKAVTEIISAYMSGARRVAYLSGVGTGKSFVFLGLAEQRGGKHSPERACHRLSIYPYRRAYGNISLWRPCKTKALVAA